MAKNNGAKNLFNKRSLKYGTNAAVMTAAVIIIALVVNLLVDMLDLKLDLTPNKLYSLSETTENILSELDKPVEIIGLFDDGTVSSGSNYKQITDLLALYEKYPNITVKYIDPDKNTGIINQLDPDDTMDLGMSDFVVKSVVNGNEKKKKLDYYDLFEYEYNQYTFSQNIKGSNAENSFTGAIKYVTSEYTPVIYFTEGHDENNVDNVYGNLRNYLEKNNILVKNINLMTVDAIPEDAEMLVVASPKQDFTYTERDLLDNYIYNGGNVIFLFDYLAKDPSFDQLNGLLSKYNIAINYDKVKETDESRHLSKDPYTIFVDVYSNDIMSSNFSTIMTNSRSISILKNKKDYITTTSLIRTKDSAIGEMVDKSRGSDNKGPLDIAVAVEYKGGSETGKIITIGNSSFISDSAYQYYGDYYIANMNFFLSCVNWMVDIEDDIIVPTKNYDQNMFSITDQQSTIMGIVLIVVFPLIIFGTGLMVYLRRRHL